MQSGRVLFVRLPRDYIGSTQQPDANDVACAFSMFGPIANVEQVDDKGGFFVTLGGDVQTAMQSAQYICMNFHGKANLHREELVIDSMQVEERICGAIIGHRGQNLRDIKAKSGAHLEVTPWCGTSGVRVVQLWGTAAGIAYARQLIFESAQPLMGTQVPLPQPLPISTKVDYESISETSETSSQSSISEGAHSPQMLYFEQFPALTSASPGNIPQTNNLSPQTQTFYQEQPTLQAQTALQAQTTPQVQTTPRVQSPNSEALNKGRWSLVWKRVSLIDELKKGMQTFRDMAYQAKVQEAQAERRGIRFGVRSKSWAHFLNSDNEEEAEDSPQQNAPSPVKPNGVGLQRTCSTDALLQSTPHALHKGSLIAC